MKKDRRDKRRKPVREVDLGQMWNYEYDAHNPYSEEGHLIRLASDSINNLQNEIKRRGWLVAIIQIHNGLFSVGQSRLTDTWIYKPKYGRLSNALWMDRCGRKSNPAMIDRRNNKGDNR